MVVAILIAYLTLTSLARALAPATGVHPAVAALRRVQQRLSETRIEALGADDSYTASPMPLFEQLKREAGQHDRHHPQDYGEMLMSSHRRAQAGSGVMTDANTEPLKIAIDFSAMFDEKDTAKKNKYRPAPSTRQAYSTCFHEGEWFKWNFPSSASPPCKRADGWQNANTWAAWRQTNQDSCGGTGGTVYNPSTRRDGAMCNRLYDPSAQNCWGVCLKEDVLRTDNDKSCNPQDYADPTVCNMREWIMDKVIKNVEEISSFFRVRKMAGNLILKKSEGAFGAIYRQYQLSGAECAKDARRMYRLPVDDFYCIGGVDAHTVFYPLMGQYIPNVAGWGGDAAKDQYGRPTVLVMGISVPQTAQLRQRYDHRAIILHELVHGLGFGIWNFQNSYTADGKRRKIVELQQIKDVDNSTDEVCSVSLSAKYCMPSAEDTLTLAELCDGLGLVCDFQTNSGGAFATQSWQVA